jgi:putative restriction endonuclease
MQDKFARLEALIYYSRKFERLRVDRAHGLAPHKPILLLSVIEQISKEIVSENRFYFSSELIHSFLKFWSYLGSFNHNPDISMPFFYMQSGKFWHLWANPGYEKIISSKEKLKTFSAVKQAVNHAYLDEDLFDFLKDPITREILVNVLSSQWFPGKIDLIEEIFQSNTFRDPPEYLRVDYARIYS